MFDLAALAKEHRADLEREARLEQRSRQLLRKAPAPTAKQPSGGCNPAGAPAGQTSAA
jgi:hypothetical protein